MKFAIFSDIHANFEALERVLDFYKKSGVDRYICLGDVIGYGANPLECLTATRDICDFTLIGNHDAAVSGRSDYSEYYDEVRISLDWTKMNLPPESLGWLKSLEISRREDEMGFCHGNPLVPDMFEYLYLESHIGQLTSAFSQLPSVTFIGHSHLTICFEFNEKWGRCFSSENIELNPEYKYICTVGSVGQPRDRDKRSCCTMYDTKIRRLQYFRLEYDFNLACKKIQSAGLPEIFGQRLIFGL